MLFYNVSFADLKSPVCQCFGVGGTNVQCVECINDNKMCLTFVNNDTVRYPQPGSIKRKCVLSQLKFNIL